MKVNYSGIVNIAENYMADKADYARSPMNDDLREWMNITNAVLMGACDVLDIAPEVAIQAARIRARAHVHAYREGRTLAVIDDERIIKALL